MKEKVLETLKKLEAGGWEIPEIPNEIPYGDMPGDRVGISKDAVKKSSIIMKELIRLLPAYFEKNEKVVITVCGGSGVGKSGNASLISYYLNQLGIGTYTLSGDNYPRRIPMYNDAERLHIFRQSGLRALVAADLLTAEVREELVGLQEKEEDANLEYKEEYTWFESYINGAIEGLKGYLGTKNEIDFDEISDIVARFKSGKKEIYLKRMGRTDTELWYDKVDFSDINVLVVEWTHGNSDYFEGIDIPIFLNSTPEETMLYRKLRNRDGKVDSAFTTRVLEIEQALLASQAHKAKIIMSKDGKLLTYEEYIKTKLFTS